jgi:hypothetical protein
MRTDMQQQQQTDSIAPQSSTYETCEQCAAPVEATQRYCVNCGTRRRHVDDPAARFMSTATSRAREAARRASASASANGSRATARSPRGAGLGLALAIALIPAGIGLGVVIGHSGNGSPDAALIAALKAQKQQVINVGGGAAVPATSASSTTAGASKRGPAKASTTARAAAGSGAASGGAGGPAAVGYKPSAASLSAGSQVAAKVSQLVGKSYVGSQSGLPSVVSVK